MKIAILTPCYTGKRDYITEKSISKCKKYFKNIDFISFITKEVYIHRGRIILLDELNKYNQKNKIDLVLWLDSDVSFEPEQLSQLIQDVVGGGLNCVSGVYFNRHENHHPMYCVGNDFDGFEWDYQSDVPNNIFPVDGIGLGFFLIKMPILEYYCKKYDFQNLFNSNNWYPRKKEVGAIFTVGEDIDFCKKLLNLGYKTYVDGRIKLDHSGINYKDYLKWKKDGIWKTHCQVKIKKY